MDGSKRRLALACAAMASMVAACGGGSQAGTPLFKVPTQSTSSGSTTSTASAPVITTQPANSSVTLGSTATLSIVATGTGLGYQWMKNGTAIANATASTYTTPPAAAADNGAQYTVVVTNGVGSVTSAAAQFNLVLSADQQAFESLILTANGGSYSLGWNLNYSGPKFSGTNYAYSDFAVLTASPLTNGPQTFVQSAPLNLSSTLALVAPTPTRILKNGIVLVVPGAGQSDTISYVGASVRADILAADNSTVAYSVTRSNYVSVPLTGLLGATPADFAHSLNSFFSNAAILNANASWGTGAAYIKFRETSTGDRYEAFDCNTATTDANVSACFTGTTLSAALSSGITSSSDGTTYHLTDGTITTIVGVPVWVATIARPQSGTLSSTVEYRIYFQLNGNVYTGALIKDGTTIGGSYYVSNPNGATTTDRLTFLPFLVRMNKAARDSIAAAMQV